MRPSSYLKIDNFYTATIYEKGAEVIRMLKTLLGEADFRRGMDLYFERWDGHATTVEAFIECFAEVSGRDLTDFFAWYEQAGTPQVEMASRHDPQARTLDLTFTQSTAPTPGQPDKRPLPIPVAFGLLDEDGRSLRETEVIVLEKAERRVRLEGVDRAPVLSALRGFSAPVNLTTDAPAKDGYVLLAADPDLFNRWEAGQALARDLILARAAGRPDEVGEERFAEAMGRSLDDQAAEPAFKALLLALPSESDLAILAAPGRSRRHSRGARSVARPHGGPSGRRPAAPSRGLAGARVVFPRRRRRRPPRPAQRRPGAAGRRSAPAEPPARRGHLERRRQHDRRHGRPHRSHAAGRRGLRGRPDDLLRALEGRAPGDRQVVRPAGPGPGRGGARRGCWA